MTFKIRKVIDKDFKELYQLLKQADFPYLPKDEQLAFNELKQPDNHVYAAFKDEKLAVFLCFSERKNRVYFDIACAQEFKKCWANKQILKFIFSKPYEKFNIEEFYTESLTPTARKAVEKLGFTSLGNNFYKMHKDSQSIQKYLK